MGIVGIGAPWPYDTIINGVGYMIRKARGPDGTLVPQWRVRGQRQIQERLDTGDIAGVLGSPAAEVPWNAQDFSGGMGLREQVPGIANRYYYASNVDTRIPLKVIGGPALTTHALSGAAGTVRAMAVMLVGSTWTLFAGTGQKVFSTSNGTTWSLSRDLGSGRTVTSMQVFEGTAGEPFLFVGVSAGEKYWTYSNTDGWTEDANDEAEYFAAVADELWRAYRTSNVWKVAKSTTGDTAATWAAGITVGDPASAITEMLHYDDRIYVFKGDRIFTLQAAATTVAEEVWPGGLEVKDGLNGVGSSAWGSSLYMVLPDSGLYEYTLTGTDQFVRAMGPGLLATNDSAVRGPVTAVVGERDYWLHAVVQNESGNSFVMAWDKANKAWHGSLIDLGAVTCRKMIVTDKVTTNPQIFIGMDENIGSAVLTRAGRDRSQDSNCTFASTGSLYLPRFTAGFSFLHKSFVRAISRADGLDTSNKVGYFYRSAPGAAFTQLGSAWASVPQTAIRFPSSGVRSELLDVRIDFTTGTTSTPELSSVATLYNLRPDYRRRFEFTLLLGDRLRLNNEGEDFTTYDEQDDAIANLLDAGPVTQIMPNGRTYTVMFDVEPVQELLVYAEGQPYQASMSLVCYEQSEVNVKGTYKRLEAYEYGQLESSTYAQLEAL